MNIEADFERLQSGEINSRTLRVSLEDAYADCSARLGFITPMGKIYVSEQLELSSGEGTYLIPSGILDGRGRLLVQLLISRDDSFIMKSRVYEYPVFASVDDMSCPQISDSSLKSLALIFELIDNKSDIGHSHDTDYYTKSDTDSLLALKSDVLHSHTGVYLTSEEILSLVGDVTASAHDHDERYYTRSQTDGLLSEKSDTSHSHSYTELSEKPSVNGITLTGDTDVNGLLYRGLLTSEDDCNDIRDDGVYVYSTSSVPANAPFPNASVITVFGNPENTTQKIQTAYRYGVSGYSAFRPLYAGNFLDWTKTVDSIVEEGTDGSWNYRKWSSGRMEAWGTISLTVTEKTALSISSMTHVTAECKFPSGMLSSGIEYCSLCPKNWYIISAMASTSSTTLWGRFATWTARADDMTVNSTTLLASAMLIGKWK